MVRPVGQFPLAGHPAGHPGGIQQQQQQQQQQQGVPKSEQIAFNVEHIFMENGKQAKYFFYNNAFNILHQKQIYRKINFLCIRLCCRCILPVQ